MPRLSSLRDAAVQTIAAEETFPAGPFAYALNMVLPASTTEIIINSKRVVRDFKLTSIQSAFLASDSGSWHVILGTEQQDWFSGFVWAETIFGDGALPHFIPEGGQFIAKGDFIVIQARNNTAVDAKRLAFLFQGVHI